MSVGFKPVKSEPIRGGGERFLSWILLELSIVSVPCDPGALVIARAMKGKSGRVLNARNSASLAELARCLSKSENAHSTACDMLEKANEHRARAMQHAARIAASQGTDNPDPDDGDDDSDADTELAYGVARRSRLIEIAGRTQSGSRGSDASRRARLIEVARLVHSA